MRAKNVSLDRVYTLLTEHGKAVGRDISWSINTDMREIVGIFCRSFDMTIDEAKKLTLKMVRHVIQEIR